MKLSRIWILVSFIFISACGSSQQSPENPNIVSQGPTTPAVQPGNFNKSITVGGVERKFLYHVPNGYDGSKPLPLVVLFHGMGKNAKDMIEGTGMIAKSNESHFIVASLQGTGEPAGWNSGFLPNGNTSDDIAFTRAAVQQIQGDLNIDSKRIYAAGFSNGAFFVHRVAAELPDVFAAVAVVEGTIGVVQDDGTKLMVTEPKAPISILLIHGKKDAVVPHRGGLSDGPSHLNMLSVEEALQIWTVADGCSVVQPELKSLPGDAGQFGVFQPCTSGSEVALLELDNGVHEWPTLTNAANVSGTDLIVNFFAKHPKAN